MGTSLPDTFASRIAAQKEKTADNAIGNVTGSNSVNVFLGLGLPWALASCYWSWKVMKKKKMNSVPSKLKFAFYLNRDCHLQLELVI